MNYRTVTIGEIALVIIAVFVALAYFNGWGQMNAEWNWQRPAITGPFAQAGKMGVDHDDPRQATTLYVHRLDANNTDRSGNLMRLTPQNVIYLQQKTAATSWHRYESTGRPTLTGDCWIIPVKTHAGSPTGTEPPNGSPLLVTIPGNI